MLSMDPHGVAEVPARYYAAQFTLAQEFRHMGFGLSLAVLPPSGRSTPFAPSAARRPPATAGVGLELPSTEVEGAFHDDGAFLFISW